MRDERGAVIGADFGVAEAAGPGADGGFGAGEKTQAWFSRRGGLAGGGGERDGRGGVGGLVEAGEEDGDDEEGGFFGDLHAQGGARADHGGAEVEEGARAGLGQPFGAVDADEGFD